MKETSWWRAGTKTWKPTGHYFAYPASPQSYVPTDHGSQAAEAASGTGVKWGGGVWGEGAQRSCTISLTPEQPQICTEAALFKQLIS